MNLENPGYLLIPLASALGFYFLKKYQAPGSDLHKIADRHLLKYIINIPVHKNLHKYSALFGIIFLISLALANPRWGEREYKLYSGNSAAVIILDVSNHMGCQDVRPTRAIRARQIASEIVNSFTQVNFGLLAFAKNTHLIAPVTDDKATLNNYLPAIDYKLVYQQGQELDSSLALAEQMLANEASAKKSIIVLTAGNFNLTKFTAKYPVYVIGVGTEQGAPMHDREDNHIYVNAQLQITKLNIANMKKLASQSGGKYLSYLEVQREVKVLSKYLLSEQLQHGTENTVKTWNEGYAYILLLAMILIVVTLRQGILALSIGVIMLLPINDSHALELSTWFKNKNQRAHEACEQLDFVRAAELFVDTYNEGVSLYKSGKYALALQAFKKNQRQEVNIDSLYNSGNAYYMLTEYKLAIESYEQVLVLEPNHDDAKFNIELARKKLQEQQKEKDDKDCACKDKKDGANADDSDNKKDNQKSEKKDKQNQKEPSTDNNAPNSAPDKNASATPKEADKADGQDENASAAESEQVEEPENTPEAMDDGARAKQAEQQEMQTAQLAADEQQQKWLQRINSDISNFLKTRMYIDDLKSNK